MTEGLKVISKEMVDKSSAANKSSSKRSRNRLVQLVKKQQEATKAEPVTGEACSGRVQFEGADRFIVVDGEKSNSQVPGGVASGTVEPIAEKNSGALINLADPAHGESPLEAAYSGKTAECFRLFRVSNKVRLVLWTKSIIDDWMIPILGAVCKQLLVRREVKVIVFDFSNVRELSTPALSTLIRFRNTLSIMEKRIHLVTGPELRAQMEQCCLNRLFDIQDNIYFLAGSEKGFAEISTKPSQTSKSKVVDLISKLLRP